MNIPTVAQPTTIVPSLWRILVRNELRVILRNRTSLFWVFLFPVLLFFILGLALSGGGKVGVRIIDQTGTVEGAALAVYLQQQMALSTRSGFSFQSGEATEMQPRLILGNGPPDTARHSGLNVSLEIPGRLPLGATSALEGVLHDLLLGYAVQRNAVQAPQLLTSTRDEGEALAYRRFLFSGVLVLMLLSGGLLSVALMLSGQREQGILILPAVWPVRPQFWLAFVLGTRGLVLVVAALAFLVVGHLLPGMALHLSPVRALDALVILILAVAVFLALGHAVAARSGSIATTELVANSLYYPMLLLGDLTIPLRELPFGLEQALAWLPTTQVAGGLRDALWAPVHQGPSWGLYAYLLATVLACVLLAGRVFNFSDRGST